MIPTIEKIIEGLLSGLYTAKQAITWLNQHVEDAASTPSASAQGWVKVKNLTDLEVTVIRADQNTTHILRIDKDLAYWLYELPPLTTQEKTP